MGDFERSPPLQGCTTGKNDASTPVPEHSGLRSGILQIMCTLPHLIANTPAQPGDHRRFTEDEPSTGSIRARTLKARLPCAPSGGAQDPTTPPALVPGTSAGPQHPLSSKPPRDAHPAITRGRHLPDRSLTSQPFLGGSPRPREDLDPPGDPMRSSRHPASPTGRSSLKPRIAEW